MAKDPARRRNSPTLADFQAWNRFQATALERALTDAKAWRNGYAMLAAGIGTLLGVIGDRLDAVAWQWRLALTLTFGIGLLLTAAALWLTLTIEGGYRTRTVNLRDIIDQHNSFVMYQADQAAHAVRRLAVSKKIATAAALFAFTGLIITLWLPPSSAAPISQNPQPTPVPTASASSTASTTTGSTP